MKTPISLLQRIFIAAVLLLPLLLAFSAFMLNRAYTASLIDAEFETLLAQTYSLIGSAEPDANNQLQLPKIMANPRFEIPESGLYAQVLDSRGLPVWQSNSWQQSPLALEHISTLPKVGEFLDQTIRLQQQNFREFSFGTVWEIDNQDHAFTFNILLSLQPRQQAIALYQKRLWLWLSGLAILITLVQVTIVHWGLKPLSRLAHEIQHIEKGEQDSVQQRYPKELQLLARNLNTLLDSENRQRQRYKNTLADLAHSLKTPLSVVRAQTSKLNNRLSTDNELRVIDDQVERMSDIIGHQLKRASSQAQASYQAATELMPLTARLGTALGKVYHSKHIHFDNQLHTDARVRIAPDDLMEVLGNILENAFKYGNKSVKVSGEKCADSFRLRVEDDGPGIPADKRAEILQRGTRLDSQIPGQGIGLAVATDIIASYGGELLTESSQLGGAKFIMRLPGYSANR